MTELMLGRAEAIDVIVIGAGPAGLSAATTLKQLGVSRVVVLEREAMGGGVPRHCGHPPFGMREFKRIYTGPIYAQKLLTRALATGVEIHTGVTVIEMRPNANLLISDSENGVQKLSARRVVYATGGRELPRSAQLISGDRIQGVLNTGALQSLVYLSDRRPFKRPVIIGSELVSFSAIQTCRHAKIKPVAMIEQSPNVLAFWASKFFAVLMGIPVRLSSRLHAIEGERGVESVIIETPSGRLESLDCDGVILSGHFTPESSLARGSHLVLDKATGGPRVNQFGQCSDKSYFAVGNVLRAIESAGWSWKEGQQIATWLANDINHENPKIQRDSIDISIIITSPLIKYCVPQQLASNGLTAGLKHLQLRFNERVKGELIVKSGPDVLWQKTLKVRPEKRVLIPLKSLLVESLTNNLELQFNIAE